MIRQHDVFRSPATTQRGGRRFIVVLSSHYLIGVDPVIVAPLAPPSLFGSNVRLSPLVRFQDVDFVLLVPLMTNVSARRLVTREGDLSDFADEIDRAVNRLFTGF